MLTFLPLMEMSPLGALMLMPVKAFREISPNGELMLMLG
jgi:hypothetical protein